MFLNLIATNQQVLLSNHVSRCFINTSFILNAKRKGFRIAKNRENIKKARQKAAEIVIKKKWVSPLLKMDQSILNLKKRYSDADKKENPSDNVYFLDGYKELGYTLLEAIEMHKEALQPSMLNIPNNFLDAKIELNVRLKKKTKFLTNVSGIYNFPYDFNYSKNLRIVAICNNENDIHECKKKGAIISGGLDIIKMLKNNDISEADYDYLICHNDMLLPLAEIRKILKNRFPSKVLNNFGVDMVKLMDKFKNSIKYESIHDIYEKDYAYIDIHFGNTNMPYEQLESNFIGLLNEIMRNKPEDTVHPFITRVLIKSPPNEELFKCKFWQLLKDYEDPQIYENEQLEKERVAKK